MHENPDIQIGEDLKDWIKQRLDGAVRELTNRGIVDGLLVEAKPAWVIPFAILIGKARSRGEPREFTWFICGDAPTDHANSSVASSPREAAKYFALKWQLEAARHSDLADQEPLGTEPESGREDPVDQLAYKAEALYSLVDDEKLWAQE
jgi:hypothetical protein